MKKAIAAKRPDARRARSRLAMHRALFDLLTETPLDRITGATVAEQANVGYSTFFRHYADVDALLADAVGALTDDLAQAIIPPLTRLDGSGAAQAFIAAVDARRQDVGALTGAGNALRVKLRHQIIDRLVMARIRTPRHFREGWRSGSPLRPRSNCSTGG